MYAFSYVVLFMCCPHCFVPFCIKEYGTEFLVMKISYNELVIYFIFLICALETLVLLNTHAG